MKEYTFAVGEGDQTWRTETVIADSKISGRRALADEVGETSFLKHIETSRPGIDETTIDNFIGAQLREMRVSLGMSKVGLVEGLPISRPTYRRIEEGEASARMSDLVCILERFDTDLISFLRGVAQE